MTIDNKARFKASTHSKAWDAVTASDTYVEAANAAMLIMIAGQTMDTAAANSYRLEGARQFLGILSNLTTIKKDPRLDEAQNLKTNV